MPRSFRSCFRASCHIVLRLLPEGEGTRHVKGTAKTTLAELQSSDQLVLILMLNAKASGEEKPCCGAGVRVHLTVLCQLLQNYETALGDLGKTFSWERNNPTSCALKSI